MRTTAWVVTIALSAALISGCTGQQISDSDIREVEKQQVFEALEAKNTAIVDVRKPASYRKGHIPGAINMYLPDIRKGDPRLAEAERIIVYAGGWSDPLSTAAAKRMMSMNYENVHEFKGGIEEWKKAGRKLEKSAPSGDRPETSEG